MTKFYWLNLTFACGGIFTYNGIITRTAPIFKWSIGKELSYMMAYYAQRGQFLEIKEI